MDRHEFIRMTLIQEDMEEEEKRRAATKAAAASSEAPGGWPMGVHLISTDPGDIEW